MAIYILLARNTRESPQQPSAQHHVQVQTKSVVLFAVNDNPDVEAAGGGSHWSLLVYFCHACIFRHYDSSTGRASRTAAARLHRAVRDVLAPGGIECPLQHVQAMPQQENGYDCGIYVLAMTDALCDWAERARQEGGESGEAGPCTRAGSEGDWTWLEGGERGEAGCGPIAPPCSTRLIRRFSRDTAVGPFSLPVHTSHLLYVHTS